MKDNALIQKVCRNEPLTQDQYRDYGTILRTAADNLVTLDQSPVFFTKEEVSSRLQYQEHQTQKDIVGWANKRMYVNIKNLANYMGTDDISGAHQTLYGQYSTDSLAWILHGVHFFHHLPESNDIQYKKQSMSFIKYILTSNSPKVEIPQVTYNTHTNKFDIQDGRHRLGLYSYLAINGMVYTNYSGILKIKELGGYQPYDYINTAPKISEFEAFKKLGVWDLALQAVSYTNSDKDAISVIREHMTFGKLIAYKRAINYIRVANADLLQSLV